MNLVSKGSSFNLFVLSPRFHLNIKLQELMSLEEQYGGFQHHNRYIAVALDLFLLLVHSLLNDFVSH